MPAADRRIHPFEERDSRSDRARARSATRTASTRRRREATRASAWAGRPVARPTSRIVSNAPSSVRGSRVSTSGVERSAGTARPTSPGTHGADLAERLGDDEIGPKPVQRLHVQLVERVTLGQALPHHRIDLRAGRLLGDPSPGHPGERRDPARESRTSDSPPRATTRARARGRSPSRWAAARRSAQAAGTRSAKTKPSRSTISPGTAATRPWSIGPSVTNVWNSPRSPQGSTLRRKRVEEAAVRSLPPARVAPVSDRGRRPGPHTGLEHQPASSSVGRCQSGKSGFSPVPRIRSSR